MDSVRRRTPVCQGWSPILNLAETRMSQFSQLLSEDQGRMGFKRPGNFSGLLVETPKGEDQEGKCVFVFVLFW